MRHVFTHDFTVFSIETLRYQKSTKELTACISEIEEELEAKNHSTFTNYRITESRYLKWSLTQFSNSQVSEGCQRANCTR